MNRVEHIFWDTCVIAALLSEESDADLPSIEQFVRDARSGVCKIYASSLVAAEILPSYIKSKKYNSYERFVKDLEGSIIPIAPDPNIMSLAARLRDIPYSKKANNKDMATRKLDVPDAIMLATAIILDVGFRIKLDKFHTFDNGGKRSVAGGKGVPLLDFQDWCALLEGPKKRLAQQVIDLNRCKPIHATPGLPGV